MLGVNRSWKEKYMNFEIEHTLRIVNLRETIEKNLKRIAKIDDEELNELWRNFGLKRDELNKALGQVKLNGTKCTEISERDFDYKLSLIKKKLDGLINDINRTEARYQCYLISIDDFQKEVSISLDALSKLGRHKYEVGLGFNEVEKRIAALYDTLVNELDHWFSLKERILSSEIPDKIKRISAECNLWSGKLIPISKEIENLKESLHEWMYEEIEEYDVDPSLEERIESTLVPIKKCKNCGKSIQFYTIINSYFFLSSSTHIKRSS